MSGTVQIDPYYHMLYHENGQFVVGCIVQEGKEVWRLPISLNLLASKKMGDSVEISFNTYFEKRTITVLCRDTEYRMPIWTSSVLMHTKPFAEELARRVAQHAMLMWAPPWSGR